MADRHVRPLVDSGNRTKYLSGALKDIPKPSARPELLPLMGSLKIVHEICGVKEYYVEPRYDHEDYLISLKTLPTVDLINFLESFFQHIYPLQRQISTLRKNIQSISRSSIIEVCVGIEWIDESTKALLGIFERFCHIFKLTPTCVLNDIATHFGDGAKKYTEDNWRKGLPINRMIDSMMRHAFKFTEKMWDERHDRALLWYVVVWLEYLYHFEKMESGMEIVDEHSSIYIVYEGDVHNAKNE